jgi:hypothetical protein
MTTEKNDSFAEHASAKALSRFFESLPLERRPCLGAILARMAVERYREWAVRPGGERYRSRLLACAERAEEIARAVEALRRDTVAIEREILADNPDLAEIDRGPFEAGTLAELFLIQAHRARLAAVLWRALAERDREPARNRVFVACAELEDINAVILEVSVGARAGRAGGSSQYS